MTLQSSRVWYKAKLLPAAQSIFTEGFYPEPKKRTGSQYVFFTRVQADHANQKVMIASRLAENSFRMLTLELAAQFLEPCDKATRQEMEQLNSLCHHLDKHV